MGSEYRRLEGKIDEDESGEKVISRVPSKWTTLLHRLKHLSVAIQSRSKNFVVFMMVAMKNLGLYLQLHHQLCKAKCP